jgi:hypothetical protein
VKRQTWLKCQGADLLGVPTSTKGLKDSSTEGRIILKWILVETDLAQRLYNGHDSLSWINRVAEWDLNELTLCMAAKSITVISATGCKQTNITKRRYLHSLKVTSTPQVGIQVTVFCFYRGFPSYSGRQKRGVARLSAFCNWRSPWFSSGLPHVVWVTFFCCRWVTQWWRNREKRTGRDSSWPEVRGVRGPEIMGGHCAMRLSVAKDKVSGLSHCYETNQTGDDGAHTRIAPFWEAITLSADERSWPLSQVGVSAVNAGHVGHCRQCLRWQYKARARKQLLVQSRARSGTLEVPVWNSGTKRSSVMVHRRIPAHFEQWFRRLYMAVLQGRQ